MNATTTKDAISTNANTDQDALLARIIAEPKDDLPRLVYADWLDEHDQPERAEFIRVQCELARLDAEREASGKTGWRTLKLRARAEALRKRERKLWLDGVINQFVGVKGVGKAIKPHLSQSFDCRDLPLCVDVSRGFVATVYGPLAAFWAERACGACEGSGVIRIGFGGRHGYGPPVQCPKCKGAIRIAGPAPAFAELVKREPVEQVGVMDKHPASQYVLGEGQRWFYRNDRAVSQPHTSVLPFTIWELCSEMYYTEEIALTALSDAILTCSRR